jgi:uncharacterized membrane protein SpoIIM required for sporulation/ABC-type transport system involved in multi-copper enzyme maturation permease subunit
MKTDLRLTWLVARRELIDQMRDWRILMPMLILILFFPYLMNYAAFQAVDFISQYNADLVAERVVPFFLMVVGFFPVTVSLIVALEAFVGEKERGTIEPMLSSPLADWHIYVGKLLTGTLIPLTASYVSMGLYMIGLVLQKLPFPPLDVLIQMLLLTAVQATLMVSAAIVISTQSTSVKAANLLASFVVIPVALLIQAESALIFWGDNAVLWLAILAVALVAGLIVRLGLAHFQRESLLGREIDVLNLGWVAGLFWKSYSGSSDAPLFVRQLRHFRRADADGKISAGELLKGSLAELWRWYRGQVFPLLRRMAVSIWIMVIIGSLASVLTFAYIRSSFNPASMSAEQLEKTTVELGSLILKDRQADEITASYLFFNNLRVEILMLFFGMFSFGVAAVMAFILNFALIGGVLGATQVLGFSPLMILAVGVLPHGIFELPSVLLACAAVLYMGVRMVTPNRQESISEVFIHTLADWFKIAFGLAFPLLLLAALVEAYITPVLMYNFLR